MTYFITNKKFLPPGRSEMRTSKCTSRESAARPRSIVRPKTVVSIFPPERIMTTLK